MPTKLCAVFTVALPVLLFFFLRLIDYFNIHTMNFCFSFFL